MIMTGTKFHIIHPYWVEELKERIGPEAAATVRRVRPGVGGAPIIPEADLRAGCVVVAWDV